VSVGIVVGNPKPQSRTLAAAQYLASELAGSSPDVVIDVVDLGAGLLGWGDAAVAEAVAAVQSVDLLVVASPTYKATYTGLLKLFLDQIAGGSLAGVVAVPLMLGAGPAHALAPEVSLKPVLAELGASTPTKALYLLDSEWQTSTTLTDWLPGARDILGRLGLLGEAVLSEPAGAGR
jgi:FMN reductase